MNRVAVFVDAGYLFAQGSLALTGQKLPRSRIELDREAAVAALSDFAIRLAGLPLLRIYWYDATAATGPSGSQRGMALLPNVKVRLGLINRAGEQKGVDSLIVTDMITLARNRAVSDLVLLSGDEDLRVGVQQAQELGVRVHLLGISPSRTSQSLSLLQEADTSHEWGCLELAPFLTCMPTTEVHAEFRSPVKEETGVEHDDALFLAIAEAMAEEVPSDELRTLTLSIRQTRQIPKALDGRLLAQGRELLNDNLNSEQKKAIRSAFLSACEARLAGELDPGRGELNIAPRSV